MESDPGDQRFLNCTKEIILRIYPLETDNITELLIGLPDLLSENPDLKLAFSDCMWPAAQRPYQTPWWGQLIWCFLFISMLLVAVLGNILVIWIVLAHRRMRTVTNCFLVNLAIADLLMATLNGIPNFVFLLTAHWPFGRVFCTASAFTANITVAASVFTLVAISVDRYVAIVRPLHHRLSGKVARSVLIGVWASSALLAVPCLLYADILSKTYANGDWRQVCYMHWPDGRYPHSTTEYIYNLLFLSVTYVIPVTVMMWGYVEMGKALWGRAIGEITQRQKQSVQAKKKIVRMFVLVVGVFTLCWLPYHAYYVLIYHYSALASAPASQHVYLGFYWLAMANAMFNPLIYYWMNHKFRAYFKQVLCFCIRSSEELQENGSKQLEMQRSFTANRSNTTELLGREMTFYEHGAQNNNTRTRECLMKLNDIAPTVPADV